MISAQFKQLGAEGKSGVYDHHSDVISAFCSLGNWINSSLLALFLSSQPQTSL